MKTPTRWRPETLVLALAACAVPPATSPPRLGGSTWALHAIQSMDDRQGITRVDDPAQFTLHFGEDGRASMRLDCNRATASWRSTPAADGRTGALEFGPIAGTRALCPPPRLDERVVRDLAFVRGYRFADGKLFLTLMADGGIYEWRPWRD
jgi:heat shock protein HslJ